MRFKQATVIALSALLALPIYSQQPTPRIPEMTGSSGGAVTNMAGLAQTESPEPGQPAAEQAEPEEPAGVLRIEVLAGAGTENDVATGTATAPRVRVLDEAGNPVAGAEVVYNLPASGASGVFSGWSLHQTVLSDENGTAEAAAYAPNKIGGNFNIQVSAESGNRVGTATIGQTNIAPVKKKSYKNWIILGVAAAAAATMIALGLARD